LILRRTDCREAHLRVARHDAKNCTSALLNGFHDPIRSPGQQHVSDQPREVGQNHDYETADQSGERQHGRADPPDDALGNGPQANSDKGQHAQHRARGTDGNEQADEPIFRHFPSGCDFCSASQFFQQRAD
jgi:hypothetical protein